MDLKKELVKELGLGAIAEETMLENYVKACEAVAVRYHDHKVKTLGLFSVINWVAVNDELPPKHINIITYDDRGQQGMMFVHEPELLRTSRACYTHWSKLPEPPCL